MLSPDAIASTHQLQAASNKPPMTDGMNHLDNMAYSSEPSFEWGIGQYGSHFRAHDITNHPPNVHTLQFHRCLVLVVAATHQSVLHLVNHLSDEVSDSMAATSELTTTPTTLHVQTKHFPWCLVLVVAPTHQLCAAFKWTISRIENVLIPRRHQPR